MLQDSPDGALNLGLGPDKKMNKKMKIIMSNKHETKIKYDKTIKIQKQHLRKNTNNTKYN